MNKIRKPQFIQCLRENIRYSAPLLGELWQELLQRKKDVAKSMALQNELYNHEDRKTVVL